MSMLSQAHFLRPWWLLLLGVALLMIWWRRPGGPAGSPWQKVIDAHLLPYVMSGSGHGKRGWLNKWGFPLFLALIAIALSGPTFMKIPDHSTLAKKRLAIVLELSPHMLASDISPSRLKRAIYKLGDLLREQKGREVALIAFAGDAHIVVPFTEDHRTILTLGESLGPSLMPVSGTNLAPALDLATELGDAQIIVMTSSNLSDQPSLVRQVIEQKKKPVTFWWFATSTGAPMLTNEGNFARSRDGGVNLSILREDIKNDLASSSLVSSQVVSADNQDILAIGKRLDDEIVNTGDGSKNKYDSWYDLGPYVLALAMILFWWGAFVQGELWWMLALFLVAPLPKAQASTLSDWFLRPDQRAHQALLHNEPAQAAELYSDNFAKGTALIKAQKFEEALKYLQQVNSSDASYNLGNAYAQLGKIAEAIAAYTQALKLDPENLDAKANKELLEKLSKDQEKQEQKKSEEDQKDQQEQKDQKDQQEPKDQKEPKQDQEGKKDQSPKEDNKPSPQEKQGDAKPESAPKAPPPQTGQKDSQDKSDKNTNYYLDQLERNNIRYLKSKFSHESRQRQRGKS